MLDALLGPAPPRPGISNSPSAWRPFAPGFWAGAVSSIQGIEVAEDGYGTRRRGQPSGRQGQEVLSWLRVGIPAQPGEPARIVPWTGRAANLLQLFLFRLWLRAANVSPLKASSPLQLPDKPSAVTGAGAFLHQRTVQQSRGRRKGSASTRSKCQPRTPASSKSRSRALLSSSCQ